MDFYALVGVFYNHNGSVLIKPDDKDQPIVLDDILNKFKDKKVHLVMHHWPPDELDVDHWGGGCCLWEGFGECPAGHHNNPAFLLHIDVTGLLFCVDGYWSVGGEDLPLDKMVGHRGRLVISSVLDLDTNDSVFEGNLDMQVKDLQHMLDQFKKILNNI